MRPRIFRQMNWLAVLLLLGGLAAHAASTDRYKLATVNVDGHTTCSGNRLLRALHWQPQQPLSIDDVRAAAQQLLGSGYFSHVSFHYQTQADSITVGFTLTDAGNLFPVRFVNFPWWNEAELTRQLEQRLPLFRGEAPEGGAAPDELIAALESLLREQGVTQSVSWMPEGLSSSPHVRYFIQDLPLTVATVVLTGRGDAVPADLSAAIAQMRQAGYDSEQARVFAAQVVPDAFRAAGYLRVSTGAPQVSVSGTPQQWSLTLTVPVTPGLRYRWEKATWQGIQYASAGQLNHILRFQTGSVVNGAFLASDFRQVQHWYGAQGFLSAHLTPQPSFDDHAGTVTYQVQVQEGPRYRVAKVELVGLPDDLAARILQDVGYHPGEFYTDKLPEALLPKLPGKHWSFQQALDPAHQLVTLRAVSAGAATPAGARPGAKPPRS